MTGARAASTVAAPAKRGGSSSANLFCPFKSKIYVHLFCFRGPTLVSERRDAENATELQTHGS